MRCALERLRTQTNYKDIIKERKYTHLQYRPICLSFFVRADIFPLIYGNGYVFMEIPQSLIIFYAPFTVKLFLTRLLYNHEIPVLHDYKKIVGKSFTEKGALKITKDCGIFDENTDDI